MHDSSSDTGESPRHPRSARACFTAPPGEPALVPAGSVTWRVFRNPVATYVGGITAVVLELAEPRVCAGVWNHSSFRSDPLRRLRRTGLAAMVTVYGARSEAERMIAGVRRMHARVSGVTDQGEPYQANDPELLDWVQATASFGFLEAYARYAAPLDRAQRDAFYAQSAVPAQHYGARGAPRSQAALDALFAAMLPRLQANAAIFEFLGLMRRTPVFPWPLRPLQGLLLRAAVELVPAPLRERLGLGRRWGLRRWEGGLVRLAAGLADRWIAPRSPAAEACRRLGLDPKAVFARQARPLQIESAGEA